MRVSWESPRPPQVQSFAGRTRRTQHMVVLVVFIYYSGKMQSESAEGSRARCSPGGTSWLLRDPVQSGRRRPLPAAPSCHSACEMSTQAAPPTQALRVFMGRQLCRPPLPSMCQNSGLPEEGRCSV